MRAHPIARLTIFVVGICATMTATSCREDPPRSARSPDVATETARPAAFDHGPFDLLLTRYVDENGRVDYDRLSSNRGELDAYVSSLASATPDQFPTDEDRSAFWINAYNASTIRDVVDDVYGKHESVLDVDGFFDEKVHLVAGASLTLDEIESRLRSTGDPRIHFALVCASTSCPKLQRSAYEGGRLESQLATATNEFLSDPSRGVSIDRKRRQMTVSPIFKWYAGDFSGSTSTAGKIIERSKAVVSGEIARDYIARTGPPETARFVEETDPSVSYFEYDWSLNAQRTGEPR